MWYPYIRVEKTVEILNYLHSQAAKGEQIFHRIYSEEEINEDPSKADTGIFVFRGTPGKPFAITNAGGGFAYVGAMHDSFPHSLELSKAGYTAFALIYRPDDPYNDLARPDLRHRQFRNIRRRQIRLFAVGRLGRSTHGGHTRQQGHT